MEQRSISDECAPSFLHACYCWWQIDLLVWCSLRTLCANKCNSVCISEAQVQAWVCARLNPSALFNRPWVECAPHCFLAKQTYDRSKSLTIEAWKRACTSMLRWAISTGVGKIDVRTGGVAKTCDRAVCDQLAANCNRPMMSQRPEPFCVLRGQ